MKLQWSGLTIGHTRLLIFYSTASFLNFVVHEMKESLMWIYFIKNIFTAMFSNDNITCYINLKLLLL